MVHKFRRKVVFEDFILQNPHLRFLHRHFCQRNTILNGRHRHSTADFVHLFLRISRKNFLCFSHLSYFCRQRFHGRDIRHFVRLLNQP